MIKTTTVQRIQPGEFEAHNHWYPKALNATIHPMVNFFLNLTQDRIINRYCHLHPRVHPEALSELLNYKPRFFHWAGSDLINVTSAGGMRQMVVIETNSCPSGQKSMPLQIDHQEQGSYRQLIENGFRRYLKNHRPSVKGRLAVIYDKNYMEASGYAAVMADVFNEEVLLVPFYQEDEDPPAQFKDGVLFVRDEEEWVPVRAAFRYLTQKPWNRVPLHTKTRIFNPIVACLAGGRNKMVAAKAYDFFNSEITDSGLKINTPETIWDVQKNEVPLWVNRLGGHAVIKVPYSNAGQGVYTITSSQELDHFMSLDFDYDQFIVQSLIGNYHWSSTSSKGKLYHVGTIPNAKGHTFVADIRMMIGASDQGLKPLCVYARRAMDPLTDVLTEGKSSWEMLGTNLSIKKQDGGWDSDTNRLVLMDRRDFNKLGIGLDDLIEAYIQTILSVIAIDKMSQTLINKQGKFRMRLFKSLNDDLSLIDEILK